jgi:DNA-binding transcriptional LysR family regulator
MDDTLDLRQLEAFTAVISAGGITAAAHLLGRSQPSITRQVQELETQIGFALLDRKGRHLVLTERGALFHAEVERHLAGLQHLRSRAAGILHGDAPALEIAAIPAFAAGLLSRAVAQLPGAAGIRTHLQAVGGEEVVRLVLARIADLGLCSLPLRESGLDVHFTVEVPCVAVLRADDPLAAGDTVPLRLLADRRLITTANPYRLRRHVDDALREAGLSRHQPLDTNTSFSAMGAVRAGLGIALIEPLTPVGAPVEGLVVRAIDRHLPFRYGIVTARGRLVSALTRALVSALREVLAEMVPGAVIGAAAGAEGLTADPPGAAA